jgi:predicted metal-dependent enzyme (double-stranded beta helix superfamily)
MFPGFSELVARLDEAVDLGDTDAITARVKTDLCDLLARSALALPERFRQTRPEGYARRLLHQDEQRGYTAVVMTWAPGQATPLHDHGGLWCVEGVVDGLMQVTQFDLTDVAGDEYGFVERGRIEAGVGTAGSLIPPWDYHVLGNALDDRPSITLHVYGGDLTRCHVFLPRSGGRFERHERCLSYHD